MNELWASSFFPGRSYSLAATALLHQTRKPQNSTAKGLLLLVATKPTKPKFEDPLVVAISASSNLGFVLLPKCLPCGGNPGVLWVLMAMR
jgi:hypothetical protein